jgi:DNA-binding XRE family transcriptional regulator
MEHRVHPLRAYRLKLDPPVNLGEAAKALGVSKATLSRIETWEQDPQPELMRRIAQWSGDTITPNDLLADASAAA